MTGGNTGKWLSMSAVSKQQEKGSTFRAMHAGEPFVIPNPWDVGSARVLEALGFTALATTSSGFAFTLGLVDGRVTLDQMASHVAAIDAATDLPVSADLENGYGPDPADAAEAIRRVARAGAVGGSIEDFDRESRRLDEIGHAAERIRAAVEAARGVGFPFTLTARAENHIRGKADLADTIRRLRSFEDAGADVLYAPGLGTIEEIRALCDAVSKPVNVLAVPGLSVAEIVDAGAQRISVGGSLTWVAVEAFADAAGAIRDRGDLSALDARVPLDDWFGD
jgi:2-methylisocitrate lyase-like PEP mutase family enzyme